MMCFVFSPISHKVLNLCNASNSNQSSRQNVTEILSLVFVLYSLIFLLVAALFSTSAVITFLDM